MINKQNKNIFQKSTALALIMILGYSIPNNSFAANNNLNIKTQLKTQYISEDNADLGTRSDKPQSDFVIDANTIINYRANDYFSAGAQIRGLKSFGVVTFQDDEGDTSSINESYFELRQIWAKFTNLFGSPYYNAQIGRQRIREDRATMWNKDFDAIRISYDTTLLNGFLAAGQNLTSYRTGTDSDFQEDDEKRFRLIGQTRWQWALDNFVEVRALYENDYSGLEKIGQLVKSDNRDNEDNDLLWTSIRATGIKPVDKSDLINRLKYRVDLMGVYGKVESINTSPYAPDTKFRTVTSHSSRDVRGWAFDGGIEFELNTKFKTTLMFNYAFASGDSNQNGTDNSYRQTGLYSNSSYNLNSYGSIRNYGEVFRPELRNMHILSAGMNMHIFDASDINILYHYYRRDEKDADIGSSGISAALVNNKAYIGQELDFVSHINIGKEFGFENKLAHNSTLKLSAGTFESGDAYGSADGERAFRGMIELRIKF